MIAVIQAGLSGCQQLSILTPESEAADVELREDQSSPATPEHHVSQNPYFLKTPEVPGKAQRLFDNAIVDMQSEDWQAASLKLKKLTEKYPELSGPWLNLGIVHYQQGNQVAAEQQFKKAIEINQDNLQAYNQLAILYREKGQFTQAESLYKRALNRWQEHAPTHCNLGILYNLYLHKLVQAEHHFKECQRLNGRPEREINMWLADLRQQIREHGAVSKNVNAGE